MQEKIGEIVVSTETNFFLGKYNDYNDWKKIFNKYFKKIIIDDMIKISFKIH